MNNAVTHVLFGTYFVNSSSEYTHKVYFPMAQISNSAGWNQAASTFNKRQTCNHNNNPQAVTDATPKTTRNKMRFLPCLKVFSIQIIKF